MPPVNGAGEPGAGEPHARFEVAGAGKGMTWSRSPGVAQPTGKPAEERPWALPSDIITSPAPDPTSRGGLLRISLLADRFGWRRAHSPDEGRPRTLGRPGVAPSRCRLPSAGAGSDRERDPGQLFGDCPQAALDGRVAGSPAGVGQFRVAPGPEQSARAVVLAAEHAGVG